MWKDYFYYTRNERRGIIVLLCIIIISLILLFLWKPVSSRPTVSDKSFAEDYQAFVNSLEVVDRKAYNRYYHPFKVREVILAPFDPNTADSTTFLRLGLKPWMAHNILKYRSKGGRFRRPDDFKKIYGLSEGQFDLLRPYITITEIRRDTVRMIAVRDTTRRYPVKFTAPVRMEINGVDTIQLKRIPGVGSGIAKMIVNYRQKLGGYYSIRQLDEIHLISANLSKWFSVTPELITRLPINKVGLGRLNSHPYINFYQAKVIVEHRRKHGPIRNLHQLSLYEEFSSANLEQLSHYLSFD